MQINKLGLELLQSCEGCRLTAYPDPASGGDPWTIGYGHTGEEVVEGLVWTQEQAVEALQADLDEVEQGVESLLQLDVSSNKFSALVCFAYNVGLDRLEHSHLLSKVNAGDFDGAADEFLRWNRAAGKVMAGLTARRQKERELFLTA